MPYAGGDEVNEPSTTELSPERDASYPVSPAHPLEPSSPVDSASTTSTALGRRHGAKPPKDTQSGDTGDAAPESDMTPTRKRRRITRGSDSGRMPALRLNRYVGRVRAERKPVIVYDTQHTPGYLRLTRLMIGVALLAAAWVASLLVVALSESLWDAFPHQPSLTARFALYLMGAIGILWLAVVALALIVVGALSLSLALTRRGW